MLAVNEAVTNTVQHAYREPGHFSLVEVYCAVENAQPPMHIQDRHEPAMR